jgi:tRNA 2-(methylsulfanyl)-N6-isopentenyladenosine37 hydroxylase
VATPVEWVDAATERWRELLVDHANCEKKAASTALALMFAYPEDFPLASALSRLAREELRHFEQVQALMRELGVPHRRLTPARYATGLRQAARSAEPGRKLDLLLVSALIEARSCERFQALAPRLPAPLGPFYRQLERSESRHFRMYLGFAAQEATQEGAGDAGGEAWRVRLRALAAAEAELIASPDADFRMHSGLPAAA